VGATLSHSKQGLRLNAREYFRSLQITISGAPHIVASDVNFDEIAANECYIRGMLTLTGGYELHIAEYVITEIEVQRPKYRYHLQRPNGILIARWDNVPHHHDVSTSPHHRHNASGSVHPSPPMDVSQVLTAVIPLITSSNDT